MAEKKVKKWQWYILVAFIVFGIGLKIYQRHFSSTKLELKGQEINVLVAKTIYQQYKGLGGRKDLGDYDGMIFPYLASDKYTFVMRDMKFPIDIIWFDNGTVVDIAPNVQIEPEASEAQFKRYYPRKPANLVLELPAGWAEKNDLKIGDKIGLVEE
ncbi:MAG: DUF192 domain-containing protein [Candidatus Magasanikiibacteriota bacterium]